MNISVKSDIKQLARKVKVFSSESINKATNAAINKTIDNAFTESKKMLTDKYAIKSSDIKRVIKKRKSTLQTLTGMLWSNEARLGFSDVAARLRSAKWLAKVKAGAVYISVLKGSQKKLRHGFMATMKSGHRGAFERDINKQKKEYTRIINGKAYKVKQNPIKEIKGASVSGLFGQPRFMSKLNTIIKTKFAINFERAIKFYEKL